MAEASPIIPSCLFGGDVSPMVLLRWLEDLDSEHVELATWHDGLAGLPELLRLGNVKDIVGPAQRGRPRSWWWHGSDRAKVQVRSSTRGRRGGPVHHGDISPVDSHAAFHHEALAAMTSLARIQDAAAVCGGGHGADWGSLLRALNNTDLQRPPPLAGRQLSGDHETAVWNPVGRRRTALAAMHPTDERAPWSLVDNNGRHHAVQLVEGPVGPEWLTALELDALEARHMQSHSEPVGSAHWEVSERVLDNGLVRAELDEQGMIVRLCFDGRFLAQSGPLLMPMLNGSPLSGRRSVSVLEDGPVRARIQVVQESGHGVLSLFYTLVGMHPELRITCSWHGDYEQCPSFILPTDSVTAPVTMGWSVGGAVFSQRQTLDEPEGVERRAVRHVRLGGDRSQAGLGIASPHGLHLRAAAGTVELKLNRTLNFMLCDGAPGGQDPAQLSGENWIDHRPSSRVQAPPFRVFHEGSLVIHWIRPLDDGRHEMLISEGAGHHARLWIHPFEREATDGGANRVDVYGNEIAPLQLSKEGDSWRTDLAPWSVALVAW